MVAEERTHYDVLDVDRQADKEAIRAAYRERLDAVRADRAREEAAKRPSDAAVQAAREEEKRVRYAWQVLSDPVQRARYDAVLEPAGEGTEDAIEEGDDDEDSDVPAPARPRSRRAQLDAARVPVTADDGYVHELAPTSRRSAAAAIDVVVMIAAFYAIVVPATLLADVSSKDTGTTSALDAGAFLGIVFLVMIFPVSLRGQTLGKRLTYTMLVDRATGQLPTLNRVLMHYAPPIIAFLLLGGVGIGAPLALIVGLSFLLTRDGMSLGDKLAKTVVVIARYRPERPVLGRR